MSNSNPVVSEKVESSKRATCCQWFRAFYIVDYILIILTIIIGAVASLPSIIPAFKRVLITSDPGISYPTKPQIFPEWAAGIVTILLPIICFALIQVYKRSMIDFHHAVLGLFESNVSSLLIIGVLKLFVGRYRPDYLARISLPDATHASMNDGQLSFPSGHSGVSLASMTFLFYYLAGKTGIFKKNYHRSILLSCMVLSIFLVSIIISISRIMDYHHDFEDVFAGWLIGFLCGAVCYKINFQPLSSTKCDRPLINYTAEQLRRQAEERQVIENLGYRTMEVRSETVQP